MSIDPGTSLPEVFLATADLDELWHYLEQSPPREIVLLNPCSLKCGSPPAKWAAKVSGSLRADWQNLANLDALDTKVRLLYESLLGECGRALNAIHGESHGDRYWRILIGPWLHYMVSAGHDRLTRLRAVFSTNLPPRAAGLDEAFWQVPVDTLDFQLKVSEDSYNFQMASQIMALLGVNYERLELKLQMRPLQATPFAGQSLAARISRRFLRRLRTALSHFEAWRSNGRICIIDTHFSRAQELQLLRASGGRVCLNLDAGFPREASPVDAHAREVLFERLPKNDDDMRVLAGLIRHNLPQCFIETYRAIGKRALTNHRGAVPKLIFSTNGWNYSEAFKQWAAGCAERGTILAGFQHGGGYGRLRLHFNLRHESKILDRFYTWGWKNQTASVVPMYFPYTPAAPAVTGTREEVLYVTTAFPRYFIEILGTPSSVADYLESQRRFVAGLSARARGQLRVRMYPNDHGWGTAARWGEFAPDVIVEGCAVPFRRRMAACSLCVCDHPGTTNFEALAYNMPTLLYWDPAISFFYGEVERDHDMLRRAGILFDTPEAAAQEVNGIGTAVDDWWQDGLRQAARTAFAEKYTRSAENYIGAWTRELQDAAALHSRGND